MIFSIYNGHVIVFNNTDLKTPSVQTFNRPVDWFRNPVGFYLNIATNSDDRAFYAYPPANYRDKTVWNSDMTPHTSTKPVAVLVSRTGFVYTLNKAGKHLAAGLISDTDYGQNVLVSADASTSYIDVDPKLSDGAIDDINEYIERLNLISQSSTQGGYAKVAWYCTLEDFNKCLEEAGERKFNDIEARWNIVSFENSFHIQNITLADIKPFTYENFAGFNVTEVQDVQSGG